MDRIVFHLLVLQTLCCLPEAAATCSDNQQAFGSSCYEFVGVRHSFFGAQDWCEQDGGHLAFIPNEETQYFLQRHLDAERDWWLGVASTSSPNVQDPTTAEAHLSWLDGSDLIYTNWLSSPQPGAVCGHILRNSALRWEATPDCNKKLPFVCQFEFGRPIMCAGRGGFLRCGSGKVIMIDGGFYGRRNIHYCRSRHTIPTTSAQHQCSWENAVESLTGHCQGHQVCQTMGVVDSSVGDPCPWLGSYLSVDYHCKHGLTVSTSTVAAVFDDVTIGVKWLLRPSSGELSCRLSTGDGHSFALHGLEGLDSSVVHKYTRPNAYVVAAECTRNDIHITAQTTINIQERITEFGAIRCYAGNLSFANCKALHGSPLQIQMEVKSGTHLTYRIQSDGEKCLLKTSVMRGRVPQNVTVSPEMVEQLGLGCHQLILYASNAVTFPDVSTNLQVCVLEEVAGLHASVVADKDDDCGRAPHLRVGVSLHRGAPVLLLFSLTGDNSSFSESSEMLQNTREEMYQITHPIQGSLKMKIKAWNVFSSVEVDVDMFASCGVDSDLRVNDHNHDLLILDKGKDELIEKHIRVVRSSIKIVAKPSNAVSSRNQVIKLTIDGYKGKKGRTFEWTCKNPCKCQGPWSTLSHTIRRNCLPDPFQYFKYQFDVIEKNKVKDSENKCITVTPTANTDASLSLSCEGCKQVTWSTSAEMTLTCLSTCPKVVWSIKDPRDDKKWESETKSCYKNGERPLVNKQHGGTQYIVNSISIGEAKEEDQDITVVLYYDDPGDTSVPLYLTYTIRISSPSSSSTTTTASTNVSPVTTTATTPQTTTNLQATTTIAPTSSSGEFGDLSCSISPPRGTALNAFRIQCSTQYYCSECQYCFKTREGKHLRCTQQREAKSIFLPVGASSSNYNLVILASAENSKHVSRTTITTQVLGSAGNAPLSLDDLQSAITTAVSQLKDGGLLSGETLAQIFQSVTSQLNGQADESKEAARQKLREQMLGIMVASVKNSPSTTPQGVQATARGLAGVVKKGSELSPSAQREASLLLENLSSSLLNTDLDKTEENKQGTLAAVSAVLDAVSNILSSPSDENVSYGLLITVYNLQTALLKFQGLNEAPTIVQQSDIGLLVNKKTPGSLHTEPIHIPNDNSVRFSLPVLPDDMFSSEEPVDVRMLNLNVNPFSWHEHGNISGTIGSLSLTRENGSIIPVENFTEYIEILIPRPAGEVVNNSILDLGNYSTMIIDVPSAESTLVFKMEPSVDLLPFKLYLGYQKYPTDTKYAAMTQMPHEGATQEERYTWLLHPEILKGNTGVHYLVVRPIVGPGIKSINATLSITSIAAGCKYWDDDKKSWSTYGCRVGVQTSHVVTHCLCNHLTVFGSSFFVTPNLVDPSRSAELFATFAENPVVVCFVGSLFVVYLLVVVWACRKDIQDTAKVKVTVLEDNDPMDEYSYLLCIGTGHRRGASTSSQVTVTLLGAEGNSEPHHLRDPKRCVFERGGVDMFLLTTTFPLGYLRGIRLWHNNSGGNPAWYVSNVVVQDVQTEQKWHFLCNSWLALDVGDCCLDNVFPVSSEMDLKSFSNLFFMKTTKDFSDGHLWFSVINRPPSSSFTRVQRVSCCFSLLLCTMLTSVMFYGIPTDPSEQTLDLGQFEFTWQQFMVGVQSSLIMFPVNLLIVSIFRYARPRETSCCKSKANKRDSNKQENNSQLYRLQTDTNVSGITSDSVFKDITRIAVSLSKSKNSNMPSTESDLQLGQQVDINSSLSVLEDFIRQNNDIDGATADVPSKIQSFHNQTGPQLPEEIVGVQSDITGDGIQKNSNRTQHLYRSLCHIEKKLRLLGAAGFSSTHSHSQAVQQVQSMKVLLEDQIFTSSHGDQDEVTQTKSSPAGSTNGGRSEKKSACCHGGLPWWFIFVGWLLVIATSCVAGYFTMLYGLKFGKERSISWLVSMVISFFQSLFVIQPLKVLCLAVFFALVLKNFEEEDFQNMTFVRHDTTPDDCEGARASRRDSRLYEPPPPADIEKMRRNKIKQQKAFALLREILTYTGFMWMLLLVAYGQRDPNAFFLTRHIRQSFSKGISDSMSVRDVFTWANTTLLNNLFGTYPGFITDGNSKLVGNARLRQVRVQRNSCQLAGSMLQLVPECRALYSWEEEDMASYDPGWINSVADNISVSLTSPWIYQTQARLRAHPVWGKLDLYRGGGFAVELGPDLQNASSTLQYLFRNTWLDMYTRAVFVEFTAYNANVNLFCIVTLLLETAAVGAFAFRSELQSVRLYQSTDGLHIFVMAAEVIYLLFILYYMYLQAKLLKQQKWAYFRNKWNLLDLTIILLSWSALSVFITRALLGNRDMTYYHDHKDQFPSFYETAMADLVLQYVIAFLVLLATVKLWHLLRLNPKMNLLTATLQRAWNDISGFLVIIVIMFMAYSISCNLLYGWKMSSYKTLLDALLTIISLQMGIFNYAEVMDHNLVLGALVIGSCIVFMTFLVLNLLISVILTAFSQEQIYHKPSEEEEIVDLILMKFFGLFGISCKETKDPRRSEESGSTDSAFNNGRIDLNTCSGSVNPELLHLT